MVRSPALSWVTEKRPVCSPSGSTIATAWSVLAQSTPAVGRALVGIPVTLIVVSSLLEQGEDTRWSRDATAGRSLIGARWRTAL